MKLDKTDLKILKILQNNGRITNAALAQKIGMSPPPTLDATVLVAPRPASVLPPGTQGLRYGGQQRDPQQQIQG